MFVAGYQEKSPVLPGKTAKEYEFTTGTLGQR